MHPPSAADAHTPRPPARLPACRSPAARLLERIPLLGEDAPDALGDPVDLVTTRRCHRHERERPHPPGVLLRVGEGERRSPRDPGDNPLLDAEGDANGFDVGDQLLSRVSVKLIEHLQHVGRAVSAPALVDADQTVALKVEVRAVPAATKRTPGPTVEPERGHAVRRPGLLPVDRCTAGDLEVTGGVRGWKSRGHPSTVPRRQPRGTRWTFGNSSRPRGLERMPPQPRTTADAPALRRSRT